MAVNDEISDSEDSVDSVDSDELMVAEGRVKDENLLEENGFDPVWVEGKYPGEIPEELDEYLPSGLDQDLWQLIGSNRSIFWLFGYNDVVDVIDDPAYVLSEEIVAIPQGTIPMRYLLGGYWMEGKAPRFLMQKYLDGGYLPPNLSTMRSVDIPSLVSHQPAHHQVRSLYPLSRTRDIPDTILTLRVHSHKRLEKTLDILRKRLHGFLDLDSDQLWFRGLDLRSLALSMTFFAPELTSRNTDNGFGPGVYATDKIEYAASHAQPTGAVMVFKNPEFGNLSVWDPNQIEWNAMMATWLHLPGSKSGIEVADGYYDADVIKGAVPSGLHGARKNHRFPDQGAYNQIACVSYDACKRLAKSLVAIIYLN